MSRTPRATVQRDPCETSRKSIGEAEIIGSGQHEERCSAESISTSTLPAQYDKVL